MTIEEVQKEILDHARGISDESCDRMTTISGFTEELKSVADGLASQRNLVMELVKTAGDYAARLDAHEKWLTSHKDILARLAE